MRLYPAVLLGLFLVNQCLGKGGRGGGSRGGSTSSRGSSASSSSFSRGSTFSGSRTSSSGFRTGGLSSSSGLNNFRSNGGLLSGSSLATRPKSPGLPTSIAGRPFPATGIGLVAGSKHRGSRKGHGGFDSSDEDSSDEDSSSEDSQEKFVLTESGEELLRNLGILTNSSEKIYKEWMVSKSSEKDWRKLLNISDTQPIKDMNFTDSDVDWLKKLGIITDSSENIYKKWMVSKSSEKDWRKRLNISHAQTNKDTNFTDSDVDWLTKLGIITDSSENIYGKLGLFSNTSLNKNNANTLDGESTVKVTQSTTVTSTSLNQFKASTLNGENTVKVTQPTTVTSRDKDFYKQLHKIAQSSAPKTSAQLAMVFSVALAAMLNV